MSVSLVLAVVGLAVAAIGSGVLLSRCFRQVRGDAIGWSIAMLGLLVSLGAQAIGYLVGFDGIMFRAMEIGAQDIAPLALVLALSEVAARSVAVRFCARLYLGAFALVATVVLLLDQLADVPFSKAWPDPRTYYQLLPSYLLMYALGPITALLTLIAVVTVLYRSSQPGWKSVTVPHLIGAVATAMVAYPMLAQLVAYKTSHHLPVSSVFSLLCTLAAALTWVAASRTGMISLAALHGTAAGRAEPDSDRIRGRDQTGDFAGLWRDDRGSGPDEGWRPDESDDGYQPSDSWRGAGYGTRDGHRSADGYVADATGDIATGAFARAFDRDDAGASGPNRAAVGAGDFATGDFVADDDFATGTFDASMLPPDDNDLRDRDREQGRWSDAAALDQDSRHDERWIESGNGDGRSPDRAGRAGDSARAQLFGQITIYTLVEERVAEFDRLSEQVVDLVRGNEPDTLVYIVHAVPSAPTQRILYEVYRSRSAYRRHTQQSYIARYEADRRPYVLATNVVELGLQQAKVSPFLSVTELFDEPGVYDTSGFERPDYLREYGSARSTRHRDARELR